MTPISLRRRTCLALLGGSLVTALLSGCTGQINGGAADTSTLTLATKTQADILDVAHGFNPPSSLVQGAFLESPVTLDEDGKVVPQLADSWSEPTPGTYVFKMKKGVVFSDGTPMTSEDVAYSLQRHLDPALASQAASMVTSVKSVEATAADEVTVVLKFPNQTFLANAAVAWQVVPKKLAEAHLKDLGTPEVGAIGTGPYTVTKFSLTDGITLQANDKYRGPAPAIKTVKVTTITDPEAMRLAVSSGSVDGTMYFPLQDARKWEGLKDVNTRFFPGNSIASISLNVKDTYLSDLNVRKAIAHAINRDAVQRVVVGDKATAAKTILTVPQLKALYGDTYDQTVAKLPTYAYDVDAAKAAMAASKYPNGFEMTVDYPSGSDKVGALQSVAADLAKIGITVKLNSMTSDAFWAKHFQHEGLNLGMIDIGYSTADSGELLPDFVTSVGTQPQGFNFALYSSPEMDAKVNESMALTGQQRQTAVTGILTDVAEQVPYIPLYSSDVSIALNKKFTDNIGVWTKDFISAIKPAGQ